MNYPVFRYVFDRYKMATKDKKGLVQLEVYFNRKRKWINTGIKLYKDQWDDKYRVINCGDSMELNSYLDSLMLKYREWTNSLIKQNEYFDFDKLSRFSDFIGNDENQSFIAFVERRIEERKDIREETRRTQRTFVNRLKRFGLISHMSDLTKENILKFDGFLHDEGLMQTTVFSNHKRMKTYIHQAMSMGLCENDPYQHLRLDRGKSKMRKFLSEDELNKIMDCDIPQATIQRVRDLFIFQCFTGLSYGDLAKFNFKNVEEIEGKYILRDIRHKTEEEYYIVLLSPALNILKKYEFVLPVISNQQYNLRLKLVSDYANISIPLTSHCARHTFATYALSHGAKLPNVSKMLGHTNIKTTQIYAQILNKDVEKDYELLEQSIRK